MTTYKNEGFLFINNDETENRTFIKSRIIDTADELICPGDIIPSIMECTTDIIPSLFEFEYYTPIIKGIRVRLYWYNSTWHISTSTKIYPSTININTFDNQIIYELLDKSKVYYAIITDTDKIILTYITEKKSPTLHAPMIEHDLAFTYHIPLLPYTISPYELEHMVKTLKIGEQYNAEYGLVLFKKDGSQVEVWSKIYYLIKAMEKPDKVSIYKYYFDCLNTYAIEENDDCEIIIINLLFDINEFIIYYPEHKKTCDTITQKIIDYISDAYNSNSNDDNEENSNKIKKLNYLLSLSVENAITLISPMPSRRNSIV